LEFSAAPSRETLALSGQASRRCGRSAWAGRHQVSPSTIDCTYAVMRRQVSFLQAGPLYNCGEPLMKKNRPVRECLHRPAWLAATPRPTMLARPSGRKRAWSTRTTCAAGRRGSAENSMRERETDKDEHAHTHTGAQTHTEEEEVEAARGGGPCPAPPAAAHPRRRRTAGCPPRPVYIRRQRGHFHAPLCSSLVILNKKTNRGA
jgi:hypothetical protein